MRLARATAGRVLERDASLHVVARGLELPLEVGLHAREVRLGVGVARLERGALLAALPLLRVRRALLRLEVAEMVTP